MASSRPSQRAEALVVYESMFGNTAEVAHAVADGLASAGLSVDTVEARFCDPAVVQGRRLVVLGAPTHGFALPRTLSRRAAGVDPVPGMRELLASCDRFVEPTPAAAAFDVRSAPGTWPTSVAAQLVRKLQRLSVVNVLGTRSFHVVRQAGPLVAGDRQRATTWARQLAGQLEG